jgi:hypothetical protein
MFALWMFGNTLENVWGPKRFLIFYLVTGIGAAVCHYAVVYFESVRPVLNQISLYPGYTDPNQFIQYFQTLPGIEFSSQMRMLTDSYNEIASSTPNSGELSALSSEILKQYKIDFLNKVKFNIQYVYMIDNIYFSNNNVFSINPYLLEFELDSNNDNNNLNLINKLKQYDLNVPFWFLKYNENLDECSNFRIKYMIKGKIIDTYKSMKDYDNEKLSSIFN